MVKNMQSPAEKKAIILAKIKQIRERKESKSPAPRATKRKSDNHEEGKKTARKTSKVRKSESTSDSTTTKAQFPEGSLLIRLKDVPFSGTRVQNMWLVDSSKLQLLQKFTVDDDDDDHYIRTQQFTKYEERDASKYLRVKVLIRGKQGDRIKIAYPATAVLMDAKAQYEAMKQSAIGRQQELD